MDIIYSKHALEQMELRHIPKNIVDAVLINPSKVSVENGKKILQSVIDFKGEGYYLIRIFVNIIDTPNVVITVYRTSKFDKYQ